MDPKTDSTRDRDKESERQILGELEVNTEVLCETETDHKTQPGERWLQWSRTGLGL